MRASAPWPRTLNERNLHPGSPGLRFNPSLIEWRGGYLFAWRSGWAGSDIYLTHMDREFAPHGPPIRLELFHPRQANYGREDPRLFLFRGRLHVSYIGVEGYNGRVLRTSQLYARIGDDLRVEQVFAPRYARRNAWEKNWSFFEHGGQLYAVYSIAPHRIVRVDGERVELAHETPTPLPWKGGEMRGGAAPVLVGDEWWSFFHDRVEENGFRTYRAGLYTFEDRPPFRVQRMIAGPLLVADPRDKPGDQYAAVIWPGGAVRDGDDWVLACGVHDRWSRLERFAHADLEGRLRRFTPPGGFRWRDSADLDIYSSVAGADEYGMATLDLQGKAVLDVGGHIGTAAARARECGAALVHSYEPQPESFGLLAHNALEVGGVLALNAAVGPCAGAGRFPPAAEVEHSGGWSVVPGKGPVRVVSLDEAILRLAHEAPTGRVGLLKLDCEGCEWASLQAAARLDLVDAIAGEWHEYTDGAGRKWTAADLAGLLEPHGFTVEVSPPAPGATWGLFRALRAAAGG